MTQSYDDPAVNSGWLFGGVNVDITEDERDLYAWSANPDESLVCWADSPEVDGHHKACGAPPDPSSSLGLCAEHLAEFRAAHQPGAEAPPSERERQDYAPGEESDSHEGISRLRERGRR